MTNLSPALVTRNPSEAELRFYEKTLAQAAEPQPQPEQPLKPRTAFKLPSFAGHSPISWIFGAITFLVKTLIVLTLRFGFRNLFTLLTAAPRLDTAKRVRTGGAQHVEYRRTARFVSAWFWAAVVPLVAGVFAGPFALAACLPLAFFLLSRRYIADRGIGVGPLEMVALVRAFTKGSFGFRTIIVGSLATAVVGSGLSFFLPLLGESMASFGAAGLTVTAIAAATGLVSNLLGQNLSYPALVNLGTRAEEAAAKTLAKFATRSKELEVTK